MRRTILLLAVVTVPTNAFTTPFIIQSNHNVGGGGRGSKQQQLYSTQQQLTPGIENLPTDLPDSLSDAASIAANVRLLYRYVYYMVGGIERANGITFCVNIMFKKFSSYAPTFSLSPHILCTHIYYLISIHLNNTMIKGM